MSGPGDRQGHPGGQGTGEPADPDVEADLGPVVSRCLPDRLEEFPGGPADPVHPLPFRGVAVPPGARLCLGGGLVQHPGGIRACWRGRAGGGRTGVVGGCRRAQDSPQVGEGGPDVAEVGAGPVLCCGCRPRGLRSVRDRGGRPRAVAVAGGAGKVEGAAQHGEGRADVGEGGAVGARRCCSRAPAFEDRVQHVVQVAQQPHVVCGMVRGTACRPCPGDGGELGFRLGGGRGGGRGRAGPGCGSRFLRRQRAGGECWRHAVLLSGWYGPRRPGSVIEAPGTRCGLARPGGYGGQRGGPETGVLVAGAVRAGVRVCGGGRAEERAQ